MRVVLLFLYYILLLGSHDCIITITSGSNKNEYKFWGWYDNIKRKRGLEKKISELSKQVLPDISLMTCDLNRKFHECMVHNGSTYGCFNCGQYVRKSEKKELEPKKTKCKTCDGNGWYIEKAGGQVKTYKCNCVD